MVFICYFYVTNQERFAIEKFKKLLNYKDM